MSDEEVVSPFRLAFRVEGKAINCYLAKQGTMEGAYLIASINKNICDESPGTFRAFKELMQQAIANCMQSVVGLKVAGFSDLEPPEHEKAGHS